MVCNSFGPGEDPSAAGRWGKEGHSAHARAGRDPGREPLQASQPTVAVSSSLVCTQTTQAGPQEPPLELAGRELTLQAMARANGTGPREIPPAAPRSRVDITTIFASRWLEDPLDSALAGPAPSSGNNRTPRAPRSSMDVSNGFARQTGAEALWESLHSGEASLWAAGRASATPRSSLDVSSMSVGRMGPVAPREPVPYAKGQATAAPKRRVPGASMRSLFGGDCGKFEGDSGKPDGFEGSIGGAASWAGGRFPSVLRLSILASMETNLESAFKPLPLHQTASWTAGNVEPALCPTVDQAGATWRDFSCTSSLASHSPIGAPSDLGSGLPQTNAAGAVIGRIPSGQLSTTSWTPRTKALRASIDVAGRGAVPITSRAFLSPFPCGEVASSSLADPASLP